MLHRLVALCCPQVSLARPFAYQAAAILLARPLVARALQALAALSHDAPDLGVQRVGDDVRR